jgi:thioredoxin 1
MASTPSKIITSLERIEFLELFNNKKGGIIIKFGAEWCGPCKKIEPLVHNLMEEMPDTITCVTIDIDNNFELYALFKSKRLINGVPAIFGFRKENVSGIPDDVVVGADENQIRILFQKYANYGASYSQVNTVK